MAASPVPVSAEYCSHCPHCQELTHPAGEDSRDVAGAIAVAQDRAAAMRHKRSVKKHAVSDEILAEKRLAKAEAKKAKGTPPNARLVEKWWVEQQAIKYPNVQHTKWFKKEWALANQILENWLQEKTYQFVCYVFEHWDRIRRDNAWRKLGQTPDLEFVFSKRKDLMAEVETRLALPSSDDDDDGSAIS